MGDLRGFLKFKRQEAPHRDVAERIKDFHEVALLPSIPQSYEQASRCMDCGTPFCHWACPLGNFIPEWNDLVFSRLGKRAFELLDATNPLPEVTGRACPAICEYACVLGINDEPVTIRENELAIIERAFASNWIKPHPPKLRTGKKVAVVGSGPAGLACAARLNQMGHDVTVFERDDQIGGIMRYGIPDFKLEKRVLDRRINLWEKEGIKFKTSTNAGVDYPVSKLLSEFDALCLATGCRVPRDLKIPGRQLKGIHFAMDYLIRANRGERKEAQGKKVIVIGGGDTGADCIGVAHRQGAASIIQLEILPQPPTTRTTDQPWPTYPKILKTSSSHEEGGKRMWSVTTKKFLGTEKVEKLVCAKVDAQLREIPGTEFELEADLVILALGFLHPEPKGLLEELGLELDAKGNVKTSKDYQTSYKKVFSAGDMRRGPSLLVWAIYEGQQAARAIDQYLTSSIPASCASNKKT